MEEAKTKRTMAKAQFTRVEKALSKLLANPLSMHETTERKFDELKVKWQEVQDHHDRYAALASLEEEDEVKEEEWIEELCQRFEAMEGKTDKVLQNSRKESTEQVTVSTEESIGGRSKRDGLQLERLKLEKFSGDLRKYPAFRDGFKRHIEPMCQSSQRAFVLRAHLGDTVKEEVANIEDDLTLLWQRLDTKYGNLRKYTDTILSDLSKMYQGGSKAALHLIKTVEKAYQDLKRMGLGHEMSNSYIISVIEKKLPEEMRVDWVKCIAEKGEVDSEKVFQMLLKFLERWRNIIEYDESAIRKVPEKRVASTHYTATASTTKTATASTTKNKSKEVCWLHEDGKHPVWNCNLFRAMTFEEKMNLVKTKNACQACLEIACSGSEDPEKCERNFRCRLKDCNKPHNMLIHQ